MQDLCSLIVERIRLFAEGTLVPHCTRLGGTPRRGAADLEDWKNANPAILWCAQQRLHCEMAGEANDQVRPWSSSSGEAADRPPVH